MYSYFIFDWQDVHEHFVWSPFQEAIFANISFHLLQDLGAMDRHKAKMDGMAAIYYWGLKQQAEAAPKPAPAPAPALAPTFAKSAPSMPPWVLRAPDLCLPENWRCSI